MLRNSIQKIKEMFTVVNDYKEYRMRDLQRKYFVFIDGDMCGFTHPYIKYTCIEAEENTTPEYLQINETAKTGESLRNWTFIGKLDEDNEEACYGLIDDFFTKDGSLFKY